MERSGGRSGGSRKGSAAPIIDGARGSPPSLLKERAAAQASLRDRRERCAMRAGVGRSCPCRGGANSAASVSAG
jgi:hypothetical protein